MTAAVLVDEVLDRAKDLIVRDGLAAMEARGAGRDAEADLLELDVERRRAWVELLEADDELRPEWEIPELDLLRTSASEVGVYVAPAWVSPEDDPHRLVVEGLAPSDRAARVAWHMDRIDTEVITLRRVIGERSFSGLPLDTETRAGLASAARRRVAHHLSVIRTLEDSVGGMVGANDRLARRQAELRRRQGER